MRYGNVLIAALVLTTLSFPDDGSSQRRRVSNSRSDQTELTRDDVQRILNQAEESANRVASGEGLRTNSQPDRGPVVRRPTRMHIAVVNREGKLLAIRSMMDAWTGSEDIAIAKARTAAFFSSDENALTSRIVGELSQLSTAADGKLITGPLWGIGHSNRQGSTNSDIQRNGIVTFPGGLALYKNGKLVGGIGVSGDAVDQDEAVAFAGAAGFEPNVNVVKLGYKAPTVPAVDNP